MHGTEHCNQKCRTFRLSAPQRPFSPTAGSMLPGSPQRSSARGRSLVTAFRSPATAPAYAVSIPGSTFLACYFAPSRLAVLPVRPFGSATVAGSPRLRPLHSFWPVAVSLRGSASCASGFHSPLGLLPPSGSKRSTAPAACRPAFRIRPISVRSPQPVLLLVLGYGSTFPVRYVSGGLLFLKPLGTSFTMQRKRLAVNRFRVF